MTRSVARAEPQGIKQWEPEWVPAGTLKPSPYNPRTISKDMLASLKQGIRQHGLLDPLVVQRHSERYGEHVIVSGHQRYQAIKVICAEDGAAFPPVLCIVIDIDDRAAMRVNVAMNRVGGEFDPRLLSEVFREMQRDVVVTPEEVAFMGFDPDEFARIIKITDPPRINTDDGDGFGRSVTFPLSFADTRMRDGVRDKLRERAEAAGKMTGEIVYDLLSARPTAIPPARPAKKSKRK
jgi:hypothetical protein